MSKIPMSDYQSIR